MNTFNFKIKLHTADIATLKAIARGVEYSQFSSVYGRDERIDHWTGRQEYLEETFGFFSLEKNSDWGRIVIGTFESLKVYKGSDGYRSGDWEKFEKQTEQYRFGLVPDELIEVGFDMAKFGQEAARDYLEQLAAFTAANIAAVKARKNIAAAKAGRISYVLSITSKDNAIKRLMAEGYTYKDIMQYA